MLGISRRSLLATPALITGAAALHAYGGLRARGVPYNGTIPPSINAPVQGTSLLTQYNLKNGGTGPRTGYTNGIWPAGITPGAGGTTTGIPAYLIAQGFQWDNTGALYWNAGTSALSAANYDFSLAPDIHYDGTSGSVSLTDCAMPVGTIATNTLLPVLGFNGTIRTSGGVPLALSFCLLDQTTFFDGANNITFSRCRLKNQKQNLGDTGTGTLNLVFDFCYSTGGGVAPATNAHVELDQFNANSSSSFTVSNSYFDVSADGQTTTSPWGSAWTGIFSVGGVNATATLLNSIIAGATAVNANVANPNMIRTIWQYADSLTSTITNCALEPGFGGIGGYTLNGISGANRPIDGGGNRSFLTNTAVGSAQFG